MRMPTFEEVAAFVCEEACVRRSHLTEATSLQDDIGLYGTDIDHLMSEYSKRFGVNLDGYIWYFHTGEDGFGIGALIFRPPDMRVKRIPITIGMLYEFAQVGRWNVQYCGAWIVEHCCVRRYCGGDTWLRVSAGEPVAAPAGGCIAVFRDMLVHQRPPRVSCFISWTRGKE
jgi:hypothetical protein